MKRSILFAIFPVMLFVSCGGGEKPPSEKDDAKYNLDTNEIKDKIGEEMYERTREIFYSMPSPLELQSIVEEAGGYFRGDLLLDPQLSSQFQGTDKLAMVLGVYGTDLSYATVYHQQQEAILHLAAAQRVAKAMGITDPFQGHLLDRANTNIANKDSMMLIVSEMYWEMNSQLHEEDRNQLGVVVLASGWTEGVYIGSQLLDEENPDKNVAEVLVEQRFIADQLNEMFQSYQNDGMVIQCKQHIQPLIDAFLALELKSEPATVREENGKTIIGGNQTVQYEKEDLDNIRTIALDIRKKIVTL